jgi:aryl-alcohol dehydrogenase-like predicted oxidoreductase
MFRYERGVRASGPRGGEATIHRAIELGVTFFDPSDAYGAGHNEQLLGWAVRRKRQTVVLATKFGNVRGPEGERELKGKTVSPVPFYSWSKPSPEALF